VSKDGEAVRGFAQILGMLCVSAGVGRLFGTAYGCLLFGVYFVAMSILTKKERE
jgi:hypothetical protein